MGTVALYYILLIIKMYWYTLNHIFNKSCVWNPDFKPLSLQYKLLFLSEFIFEYVRIWVNILAQRLANKTQSWVVFLSPFMKMLGWYLDETMTASTHILSK
jgi:hypothetical protein